MKKKIFIALLCLVLILCFFSAYSFFTKRTSVPTEGTFRELSSYFQKLAEKKGAVYAYDVLRTAPLPPNIDVHLLGHVVGDELYKQKGVDGIAFCTNDFRNACSHSIVIGAFLEKGEAALPLIEEACHKAPGGSGAYTMCFHGLGHGILSYTGYDLPATVRLCEKTGTEKYHNREYIECVGGAVMEMQDGIIDRTLWKLQAQKYFKADDPTYPCSAPFMPKEVRPVCYNYLTPYLWKFVGGNIGNPTPEVFEKAFALCAPVRVEEERRECYGGFGKDFDGLAVGRDIRLGAFEKITDDSLASIYEWCTLAHVPDGVQACLVSALDSLYWGGENDRTLAERFCALIPPLSPEDFQRDCYEGLIHAVKQYVSDTVYRQEFCMELPDVYRARCSRELH